MKKQFSLLQQCHMTIYPSLGEPLGPREIKFYVGIKEDKKTRLDTDSLEGQLFNAKFGMCNKHGECEKKRKL